MSSVNILILTWGSAGDVQPYLALGHALVAAGHRVRLATSDRYESQAVAAGLEFHAAGPPLTDDILTEAFQKFLATSSVARQMEVLLSDLMLRDVDAVFHDAWAACEGMDVAICHPTAVFGQEAAISRGVPFVGSVLIPAMIPSACNPPLGMPNLGRLGNRLAWALGQWQYRRKFDPLYRAEIRRIGGVRQNFTVYDVLSPTCNLLGASPSLVPPPQDLPAGFTVTGRWFMDDPDYVMPPDLATFLDAGEPPVVVSFGSMGVGVSEGSNRIIAEALKELNCRAVVQRGWAGLGDGIRSERVFVADYVPHQLLFSRARCVVIHGGAGAAHAVALAGVPAVVVPHLMDQTYWANVLRRRGVAPRHIPYRKLTAAKLAAAIQMCLGDPSMSSAAADLGRNVRAERGCENAVAAIEAFAAGCE